VEKQTITIRVDSEKREALDAIAAGMDRDRTYILNEAITAYLETHRWHLDHINEGLRKAQAGKFAGEKEVARAFSRWHK